MSSTRLEEFNIAYHTHDSAGNIVIVTEHQHADALPIDPPEAITVALITHKHRTDGPLTGTTAGGNQTFSRR